MSTEAEWSKLEAEQKRLLRLTRYLSFHMDHLEEQVKVWRAGGRAVPFSTKAKVVKTNVPDPLKLPFLGYHLWHKRKLGRVDGLIHGDPYNDYERVYPLCKQLIVSVVRCVQRFHSPDERGDELSREMMDSMPEEVKRMSQPEMVTALVRAVTNEHDHETFDVKAAEHAIREVPALAAVCAHVDAKSRPVFMSEPYLPGRDNTEPGQAFRDSVARFLESETRSWFVEGKDPFADYRFSMDPRKVAALPRIVCPSCKRKVHVYCPMCVRFVLPEGVTLPEVPLPVNIDIVHHPQESKRKCTSIHGCMLSPKHIRMHEFPDEVPVYDPATTVFLFPKEDSPYIDELSPEVASKIKTIVCCESTWQKAGSVVNHPNLKALPCVRLRNRESTFWRYQELGNQFLATLEAMYYSAVEHYDRLPEQQRAAYLASIGREDAKAAAQPYAVSRPFDDLLLIYAALLGRVQEGYRPDADGKTAKKPPKCWQPAAHAAEAIKDLADKKD